MNLPPRPDALERLSRTTSVDVLIIGGGVNGAGLLRELALNGVSAVLVERGDFAAGASSASSRMIHGGLRYLENGEFRLVRESLRERNRLLRNAPHAVSPLPTTIPIFSWWSGLPSAVKRLLGLKTAPSARGALLIKLGLSLYDLLTAADRTLPRHHFTSGRAARAARPGLHPDIVCTATYYDASVALPERLCLELIDDALRLHSGCQALNYVAVDGADGGRVTLREQVTGRSFSLQPKLVVNATGAWIDFANGALGSPSRLIGGTKGSHLVVDHPELLAATGGHQFYYENAEGRVCIFFPLHGHVLVGSTDIRIDDPDQAVCEDWEVDYMLESIRSVFPKIAIGRQHVVSRFCGVRPLPHTDASVTGQISRDHSSPRLPPDAGRPWPIISMVGGKWTTFRAFAEQVGDEVLTQLNRRRQRSSRTLRIGGRTPAYDLAAEADLAQLVRSEAVVHLDDLLLRRTGLALFSRLTAAEHQRLARSCAAALGWDAGRLAEELSRSEHLLASRHGVALAPAKSETFRHVQRPQASAEPLPGR